ncbi:hypothetical protein [Neolewinella antarctica]|uniref:Uncharacterized protein n=1 Tax=Neolewinella antarctica TaxID=442734 RepID=A0ABX0X6G7_9BACT|nr:hypothetical protein [Neolewinella antarctica]NJC24811.1 hypothetical protein [Neolewinella antarctica]
MLPGQITIDPITRGDILVSGLFEILIDGEGMDFSEYSLRCQFKPAGMGFSRYADLTLGDGIIPLPSRGPGVFILITPTNNWRSGTAAFDWEAMHKATGITQTFITGTIELNPDITT